MNFIKGHRYCRSTGTKDSLGYASKGPKVTKDSAFRAPLQIVEPAVTPRRILLCFPFLSLLPSSRSASLYPNDRLYALKARCIPATCCTEIKKFRQLCPALLLLKTAVYIIRDCSATNLAVSFVSPRDRQRTNSVECRY